MSVMALLAAVVMLAQAPLAGEEAPAQLEEQQPLPPQPAAPPTEPPQEIPPQDAAPPLVPEARAAEEDAEISPQAGDDAEEEEAPARKPRKRAVKKKPRPAPKDPAPTGPPLWKDWANSELLIGLWPVALAALPLAVFIPLGCAAALIQPLAAPVFVLVGLGAALVLYAPSRLVAAGGVPGLSKNAAIVWLEEAIAHAGLLVGGAGAAACLAAGLLGMVGLSGVVNPSAATFGCGAASVMPGGGAVCATILFFGPMVLAHALAGAMAAGAVLVHGGLAAWRATPARKAKLEAEEEE